MTLPALPPGDEAPLAGGNVQCPTHRCPNEAFVPVLDGGEPALSCLPCAATNPRLEARGADILAAKAFLAARTALYERIIGRTLGRDLPRTVGRRTDAASMLVASALMFLRAPEIRPELIRLMDDARKLEAAPRGDPATRDAAAHAARLLNIIASRHLGGEGGT